MCHIVDLVVHMEGFSDPSGAVWPGPFGRKGHFPGCGRRRRDIRLRLKPVTGKNPRFPRLHPLLQESERGRASGN